ncbi:MAG: TlpA family protein disulfide reductase [Pedosphaera sp.]|nr:TlpA family protein disulfide reductase [Pedosphaera sp.]
MNVTILLSTILLLAALQAVMLPVRAAAAAGTAEPKADARTLPDDADAAWTAVQAALKPPAPPASWNQVKPSQEEYDKFRKEMGTFAGTAADRSKEFYTRWPDHAKAAEARGAQRKMLNAAVGLGVKERSAELAALAPEVGADSPAAESKGPQGGAEDKADPRRAEFLKRIQAAVRQAQALREKGMPAMMGDYLKSLRGLQKEFSDQPELYQGFLEIASYSQDSKEAVALVKEIIATPAAPPAFKEAAQKLMVNLDRMGRPLDIKFTAIDGRAVDFAALKGKVVLVDFWATWCGPCIQELPHVKEAYDKLHDKGFEIVGISLDQDKDALEQFVKKKKMPWPQHFESEGQGNHFANLYGVTGIPTMWLVDRKGNLRDTNARGGLLGKVEKLLAEK